MNPPSERSDVLAAASPGQHIAQLYSPRAFPDRAVAQFLGEGLRRGEAAFVVARPRHWQAVARRLAGQRFDLDGLARSGQLTVLDAASCLARLLVDGQPDRERFRTVVVSVVTEVERAGYTNIRMFGEGVDLLRRINLAATIRLEDMWNELLAARRMTVLCAYSLDVFAPETYGDVVQRVSAVHSHLVPVEDDRRLDQAVERAYADVFGVDGDADSLRREMLARYVRPAVMPDGAAAILAAREQAPIATTVLLERARHHYGHPDHDRP